MPVFCATMLLAIGLTRPAAGHPDILINCRVLFNLAGHTVDAIAQTWTFDYWTSADLLSQYDLGGDGALSDAESAALQKEVLPNLSRARYFTYLQVDGRDQGKLEPFNFKALARGGIVSFSFAMRLPAPVDLAKATLKLQVKDPDNAVSVVLPAKDGVTLQGAGDAQCRPQIVDNKADAYFGGTVIPKEIVLDCRR